eukprot:1715349-Amphidinium_carterae.2
MPANGLSSGEGRFLLAKIHLRCLTSFSSRDLVPRSPWRQLRLWFSIQRWICIHNWSCSGGRPAKPPPEAVSPERKWQA